MARRVAECPTKTNHPKENGRLRCYRLASANPDRAGIGPGHPWNPVGRRGASISQRGNWACCPPSAAHARPSEYIPRYWPCQRTGALSDTADALRMSALHARTCCFRQGAWALPRARLDRENLSTAVNHCRHFFLPDGAFIFSCVTQQRGRQRRCILVGRPRKKRIFSPCKAPHFAQNASSSARTVHITASPAEAKPC